MGNACTRWWYTKVSTVEHALEHAFRKWGLFVYKHPLAVIISSVVITGLLCIAIVNIEAETDTFKLYAPAGTVSFDNYNRYQDTWKEYGANPIVCAYQVTSPNNDDFDSQTNVYSSSQLAAYLAIHEVAIATEIKYDGKTYSYADLCIQYDNGRCYQNSILEFFDYNQTLIENKFDDIAVAYPASYSSFSESVVSMQTILGQNIGVNQNSAVTSTPSFRTFLRLDGVAFDEELLDEWMLEYLSVMEEESADNDVFDVTYECALSFDSELNRAVGSDIPSFATSFALIGVFAGIILLRFKRRTDGNTESFCQYYLDPLRNRAQLSIFGIISSVLALVSSISIVGGILGVKWNPVVSVAPFLLVGLGVDDMFVLLRSYELTSATLPISERIAITMERGGVSILFTSITDLVAFCIGATSSFGSVSAFCVYCGVGVFMDFAIQVSFFVAFMVYDSQPTTCCVCVPRKSNEPEPDASSSVIDNSSVKSPPSEEKKDDQTSTVDAVDPSDVDVLLSYMIEMEASSFPMKKLANLIFNSLAVKITIAVIFIGYLVGAGIGISQIEAYQSLFDLIPGDSYLRDYLGVFTNYYNVIGEPMNIVLDTPLDYSDDAVFERIDAMLEDLRAEDCFAPEPYLTFSWIHDYRAYLTEKYPNWSTWDREQFYSTLYTEYLVAVPTGRRYRKDIWNTVVLEGQDNIVYNRDTLGDSAYEKIDSSVVTIHTSPSGVRTDLIADCLDTYKSVIEDKYSDLGAYYYLERTVVAEADLITVQQTLNNLLFAMLAACVISIILIPYPVMTIFVMTTVGQILAGVLGYMSLWDLPINTTTMINIVLSVGFSVDNAAHMCHAFMNAPVKQIPVTMTPAQERKARVMFAMNSVGMPILAGDISTIVALIPLAAADSQIFISFWKCISLVMTFGAGYACLYLPLVLSLIGPVGLDKVLMTDDDHEEKQEEKKDVEMQDTQAEKEEEAPMQTESDNSGAKEESK